MPHSHMIIKAEPLKIHSNEFELSLSLAESTHILTEYYELKAVYRIVKESKIS